MLLQNHNQLEIYQLQNQLWMPRTVFIPVVCYAANTTGFVPDLNLFC